MKTNRQGQHYLTTSLLLFSLCIFFSTSVTLAQATTGGEDDGAVQADLFFNFQTDGELMTASGQISVPPEKSHLMEGITFDGATTFVSATVSPPGVRCFFLKSEGEPGEREAAQFVSNHLSPVFGKITEDDDLSESISFRENDQGWQRVMCFQADGSEVKLLIEFVGGNYIFPTLRFNSIGLATLGYSAGSIKELGDITAITIVQAPNPDVTCTVYVGRLIPRPLVTLKVEESNYSPISNYKGITCLRNQ